MIIKLFFTKFGIGRTGSLLTYRPPLSPWQGSLHNLISQFSKSHFSQLYI